MNEMQNSRFYTRWFETGRGWTKSFRDWLAIARTNKVRANTVGEQIATAMQWIPIPEQGGETLTLPEAPAQIS